jgi:hypothetical protein
MIGRRLIRLEGSRGAARLPEGASIDWIRLSGSKGSTELEGSKREPPPEPMAASSPREASVAQRLTRRRGRVRGAAC